jgi:hypothetical protein
MKNHSEAVNPIHVSFLVKRELSTVYVGSTDKAAFVDGLGTALKAYGLEADGSTRQKHGVRIQTRLMAVE